MKYLVLSVSIVVTLFAFSMSLETGEVSAGLSSSISISIYNFMHGIFPNNLVDFDSFHLWVRKAAHVSEFFIMGSLWLLTFHLFHIKLIYAIPLGLVVALMDEGIQLFISGRSPSLIDALVFDFLGYLFGHMILRTFIKIKK